MFLFVATNIYISSVLCVMTQMVYYNGIIYIYLWYIVWHGILQYIYSGPRFSVLFSVLSDIYPVLVIRISIVGNIKFDRN